MAASFGTLHLGFTLWGGYGLLVLGFCWLGQRLGGVGLTDAYRGPGLAFMLLLLALLLAPAHAVIFTLRGPEGNPAVSGLVLSRTSLCWRSFVLAGAAVSCLFLGVRRPGAVAVTWALELAGAVLLLHLGWYLAGLSSGLFGLLLCLELTGLLGLVLFVYAYLGLRHSGGLWASWRAQGLLLQGQYTHIRALLTFVWLAGLSTLFLLWAIVTQPSVGLLAGPMPCVVDGTAAASFSWALGHGWGPWFCAGVLLKLLLQPFQLVLLAVYRQLAPSAFSLYLGAYYVFALLIIFFNLVLPFSLFMLHGGWLVLGAIGASFVACLAGLTVAHDLRAILAFSTALNLGFLLVAAACTM